jgi:hypothetical protein
MIPLIVCDLYFNGSVPCFGGILALEGATGRELWRYYSQHEIFALNCNEDLDKDGVKDCLGGGRAAVSGLMVVVMVMVVVVVMVMVVVVVMVMVVVVVMEWLWLWWGFWR